MPKYKGKGRRKFFFTPKSNERKHQAREKLAKKLQERTVLKDKTNTIPNAFQQPTIPLNDMVLQATLTTNWVASADNGTLQVTKMRYEPPNPPIVVFCITVNIDHSWTLMYHGKEVPQGSSINQLIPQQLNSLSDVEKVMQVVDRSKVCQGSEEADFVALCVKRGGSIKNASKQEAAYIDKNDKCTIRHVNCHLLCLASDQNRCRVCQQYRATLRALKSKEQCARSTLSQKTSHDSHTSYSCLNKDEALERMRNMQRAKRTLSKSNQRLRVKLDMQIAKEGIELHEDDIEDMEQIFHEAKDSAKSRSDFQKVFWEQQQRYNFVKDKRQMPWHPLMIRWALNLKYLSSTSYKAVGQFLAHPSERTLRDYTHFMKFDAGTQPSVIHRLKNDMKFDECTPAQRKVGLLVKSKSKVAWCLESHQIGWLGLLILAMSTRSLIGCQHPFKVPRCHQLHQTWLNKCWL